MKKRKYNYVYRGRPTKLTESVVTKLEQAFAVGANVQQACSYAKIARQTYYRWIEENPDLSDRFADMRDQLPLQALQNISDGITKDKNIQLSERMLARVLPAEHGDTLRITKEGDVGGVGTPDEDLDTIAEFHAKLKANRLARSQAKAKVDGEI